MKFTKIIGMLLALIFAVNVQAQDARMADHIANTQGDTPESKAAFAQKNYLKKIDLLVAAIDADDASQMIHYQALVLGDVRSYMEDPAKQSACAAVLDAFEGFSFHTAAEADRTRRLELLRAVVE
jgi:hypothetical protein